MRSSRQVFISTAAGTVLATSLALVVVLAMGERVVMNAQSVTSWMGAWSLAAGVAALALVRRLAPRVPGVAPGLCWWFAGVAGAALLGRHALDAVSVAAAELSVSIALPGPFDLGDLVLWGLMLVVVLATSGLRSDRQPGLRMGLGLILLLAPAAVLLFRSLVNKSHSFKVPDSAWEQPPWLTAAAMVWVLALVICDRERSSGKLGLASWLPPLLGCLVLVAIPWWLLASHGGKGLERVESAFFMRPGRAVFGFYGDRIGAGIEGLATLAGIAALLCFSARSALMCRVLGSWERVVAVTAGAVLAALLPLGPLILVAALAGWLAVIMGLPMSNSVPTEENS